MQYHFQTYITPESVTGTTRETPIGLGPWGPLLKASKPVPASIRLPSSEEGLLWGPGYAPRLRLVCATDKLVLHA